jgi:TonB family protein
MSTDKNLANAIVAALLLTAAGAAFAQDPASTSAPGSASNDCKPVYPKDARRAGTQGISHLAFHVDAAGKVTQVDIVAPSGPTREHRLLDHAAASTLALCPFAPARDENGNPVASVVPINYTWRLE